MTPEEAGAILNLDPRQVTSDDIHSQFNRLSRRYPPQAFPERHSKLMLARDELLQRDLGVSETLNGEVLNLKWLERFKKPSEAPKKISPLLASFTAIMRPTMQVLPMDVYSVEEGIWEYIDEYFEDL